MKANADKVWFGSGGQYGSMGMTIIANNRDYYPLAIWTNALIEIRFQYLVKGPFETESKRQQLLNQLNEIPGVRLSGDSITGRPNIPFKSCLGEPELAKFFEIMKWMVDELRQIH